MAESPYRMCRTSTWAGILSFLGIEKEPAQDAQARSEEILLQSQKMEAIGRLAGGIAHDFNNLLAVITGYSDLLLEDLPSDLDRRKVEQIKQAANSAASLIRQLLMFSRQQVVQQTVLDLNQAVGGIEKMLRRLIRENIEFTVVLDPQLARVKADSGQIEQLVLNLVVNARDAMPNGGKLRIQTKNVRLKEDVQSGAGVLSDRFVLLEVADTGIGMDRETQTRIFEPFFTTKAVGKGTGLGLATVYAIVKQSNGSIDVQSKLGHGSSFKIFLPAAEQADADYESATGAAKPVFSGETVLVVEDAEPLRRLICDALSAAGCKVLSAPDGQEALRVVRREGSVDLLLTDVIMPGMNGPALARQVRAVRPQMKILYMTGYSGEFIRADMLTPGVSLIQKPFSPADLGRTIRKLLADPREAAADSAVLGQQADKGRKAASARASG